MPILMPLNSHPGDRIDGVDGIFELVGLSHYIQRLLHPLDDVWQDHFRPQVGQSLQHLEDTVEGANLFVAREADSEGHLKVS